MKKRNSIIFVLTVIFLLGCKKDVSPADSAVSQLKESAQEILAQSQNATEPSAAETQTMYLPVEQANANFQGGIINVNYKAKCLVEKYRGLNLYCKGKNFWHNQSTLISWYVPYSLVLLALIIVAIILWLKRRG